MDELTLIGQIHGQGQITADILREKGFDTLKKLSKASIEELVEDTNLPKSTAQKIIKAAKELSQKKDSGIIKSTEAIVVVTGLEELIQTSSKTVNNAPPLTAETISEPIKIKTTESIDNKIDISSTLENKGLNITSKGASNFKKKISDELTINIVEYIKENSRLRGKIINRALKDRGFEEKIIQLTANKIISCYLNNNQFKKKVIQEVVDSVL
ncbi:MAG: helix-hairpin-helix domain-containing protein [bacterium]